MFCNQCQETLENRACLKKGACGKDEAVSNLQDILIFNLQGIGLYADIAEKPLDRKFGNFVCKALFSTITNVNFDEQSLKKLIEDSLVLRDELKALSKTTLAFPQTEWTADRQFIPAEQGIKSLSQNEDLLSLKLIILYGMKGIGAYAHHAAELGSYNDEIFSFLFKGLSALAKQDDVDTLTGLVLETGKFAVEAMALLDKANTSAYGDPEISKVNIGAGTSPGILISGHDLKDLDELLKQTQGQGVDVYTHSEMLAGHYYPAFKKYPHFKGNYGGSWWKQNEHFQSFNGPIIMTTNCIIPPKDSYRNRIFTTGLARFKGVAHIPDRQNKKAKDFSEVISLAKKCSPPVELEKGHITGGFAHAQLEKLIDKVLAAVRKGAIKRFVVMAGCDGRHSSRDYFTKLAELLEKDTVILTAGCAKYRYNKLNLGDIEGIPRVIDAGQCNDSYSLALIALKLKQALAVKDVNELPISFDIAWYEQKAVAVLLGLLFLGFKNIRLGPTIPAFISSGVVKVLVDNFGIKPVDNAQNDALLIKQGR